MKKSKIRSKYAASKLKKEYLLLGGLIAISLSFSIFSVAYYVSNKDMNNDMNNVRHPIVVQQETSILEPDFHVLPLEKDLVAIPKQEGTTEGTTEETTEETTTETITEPATEPITEPVTEPITEAVTEPVTEPEINKDSSLDQYIYSLINEYSGYETRMDLNYDNIYLLAQLSESEAGSEPFVGKVAVCEVVLNRFGDPNKNYSSIRDVIFAYNQFSVVNNGTIYNVPSYDSVLAAVKATVGEAPTNGSLYFQDVRYVTNTWASRNREKSVLIGNHQFFY